MKLNCGEQEQESICDLNISEEICDESIRKLFANYLQKENYWLNTAPELLNYQYVTPTGFPVKQNFRQKERKFCYN